METFKVNAVKRTLSNFVYLILILIHLDVRIHTIPCLTNFGSQITNKRVQPWNKPLQIWWHDRKLTRLWNKKRRCLSSRSDIPNGKRKQKKRVVMLGGVPQGGVWGPPPLFLSRRPLNGYNSNYWTVQCIFQLVHQRTLDLSAQIWLCKTDVVRYLNDRIPV